MSVLSRPLAPLGLVAALAALACGGPGFAPGEYQTPRLSEVDLAAPAPLGSIDRADALAGAQEAADAPLGLNLDPTAVPEAFAMVADSHGMDSAAGIVGGSYTAAGPTTQFNVTQAALMVAVADAHTALLLSVPAAAVAICLDGVTTELAPNVWAATNSVSDGVTTVTGQWVVAWVGVGWLAEMRLWSSDGAYDGDRWFSGFVSADHGFGWWDVWDTYGARTGVLEWVANGQGDAELGIASTAGDTNGDVLLYLFVDDTGFVGLHDASAAQDYWVYAAADHSGELRSPDYAGGEPACWDASGYDVACPTE